MALTIVNEQYPPRKPKLTLTADSLDELPTEGVAEGSTATVDGTEYSYDSNAGWIEPGSGGGGGFPYVIETVYDDTIGEYGAVRTVKTAAEVYDIYNAAAQAGVPVLCGYVDGRVFEVFCEEEGDEADGDLRYALTVFVVNPTDNSSATTMPVACLSTTVSNADANDHPFVFHSSSYGFSEYRWTIPLTPVT